MLYHTTMLISRMDPLKYLFEKPVLLGRLARWHLLLVEFDITYVTQKSVKGQAIADHLAENPVEGFQPMMDLFPDESILNIESEEENTEWRMYFDGAVNIHGSGIWAVLVSPTGAHYPVAVKLRFPCTNNMAEYEACIAGLEAALDMNVKDLKVYGDSILISASLPGSGE